MFSSSCSCMFVKNSYSICSCNFIAIFCVAFLISFEMSFVLSRVLSRFLSFVVAFVLHLVSHKYVPCFEKKGKRTRNNSLKQCTENTRTHAHVLYRCSHNVSRNTQWRRRVSQRPTSPGHGCSGGEEEGWWCGWVGLGGEVEVVVQTIEHAQPVF